jgi:hypothetical protein
MSDYYMEFNEDQWKQLELPGPYILIPGSVYHRYLPNKWILAANRVWREYHRDPIGSEVYFAKNRNSGNRKLNDEELKEFVWVKLSAYNI